MGPTRRPGYRSSLPACPEPRLQHSRARSNGRPPVPPTGSLPASPGRPVASGRDHCVATKAPGALRGRYRPPVKARHRSARERKRSAGHGQELVDGNGPSDGDTQRHELPFRDPDLVHGSSPWGTARPTRRRGPCDDAENRNLRIAPRGRHPTERESPG